MRSRSGRCGKRQLEEHRAHAVWLDSVDGDGLQVRLNGAVMSAVASSAAVTSSGGRRPKGMCARTCAGASGERPALRCTGRRAGGSQGFGHVFTWRPPHRGFAWRTFRGSASCPRPARGPRRLGNQRAGVEIDAWTGFPGWDAKRIDATWTVDALANG
jgi:hypothetical protein